MVDAWIRDWRPVIAPELVIDAVALVEGLREHVDVWEDPEARLWYLRTSSLHLEDAMDRKMFKKAIPLMNVPTFGSFQEQLVSSSWRQ